MPNPLLARITSDPAIPGQHFAVEHLLGHLCAGMGEAALLDQFPCGKPDAWG